MHFFTPFTVSFANSCILSKSEGFAPSAKSAVNSPTNPPNYIILENWIFENFFLAGDPFTKALQSLLTCVLVNNNLWEN